MESGREIGWQFGKTALECHRYMFEKEIATDVCFKVGPTDDAIVRIRAHKYVLISRCEVFDAMFSSGMVETQGGPEAMVRIEDIEPDVFKEMLRFIYSDSADMTTISVYELMYAAKKYMLPNLVQLCSECLMTRLTAENVCRVMNESLFFEQSDLTNKCIDLVERESSDVLKHENLLISTRETLGAILQLDCLEEDETVIYDTCVSWAKAQLKGYQSIDHPNDQQIREMLGDLIYEIRFPIMDAKAFANLVESSTILSYEEHSSILCYILNQRKKEAMKFNCEERFGQWKKVGEEHFVDRGGSPGYSASEWKSGHDAIDVKTERKILVTGLGLLSVKGSNRSGYSVELEILKSTKSVLKMSTFVPYADSFKPHKVSFTKPVIMEHGILYTIIANSSEGHLLHYRQSYGPICHANNVTFTFSNTTCRDSNNTSISQGQIPRIYFKGPK